MHCFINKYGKLLVLGILVLVSASCKVLLMPETNPDENLFRDLDVTDSTNFADLPWKELFTDSNLQSLIELALQNNPDLHVALARMKKAEAVFRQSRVEFFPSLNAGFNAIFQNQAAGQGPPEAYQLYAGSGWEADIWGKFRSSKRAALASLLASEAFKRAVTTELIASVASGYYTLMALDQQLGITEQTLEKRIRNVEVMEVLKENDVITGADLVLSQANRYSAEVMIPDLRQAIYELENNLSMLTGQVPGPIERSSLDEQDLSPALKTGIPAQLLANRPDVREAEFRLRAAYEMTKVARSYFYPSLTLNARSGISDTDISQLFSSGLFFWNIAAGLTQPVFNSGLNRQRLRMAQADMEESQALFRRTLLAAGQEVVNSMHGYQTATEKIGIRARQIEFLEKSVEYTTELLKYTSSTNYLDVLTSEVNLLSAQLNSVNDKLEQLHSIVSLYRSLGGGWK